MQRHNHPNIQQTTKQQRQNQTNVNIKNTTKYNPHKTNKTRMESILVLFDLC